jgi:hypothetical protein
VEGCFLIILAPLHISALPFLPPTTELMNAALIPNTAPAATVVAVAVPESVPRGISNDGAGPKGRQLLRLKLVDQLIHLAWGRMTILRQTPIPTRMTKAMISTQANR